MIFPHGKFPLVKLANFQGIIGARIPESKNGTAQNKRYPH